MENCLNIFEQNLDNFIKISISDRKKILVNEEIPIKCGVLFINFNSNDNNVIFIPIDKNIFRELLLNTFFTNTDIIEEQFNYFLDKYNSLPKSFIFFCLKYNNETLNMELDLDKNNSYSKTLMCQ